LNNQGAGSFLFYLAISACCVYGNCFFIRARIVHKEGMERPPRHQKIAVTVWGERISPVFDAARTLLIVEIVDQEVRYGIRLNFVPERVAELVRILQSQQVTLLICGAVSAQPAAMLEAGGIELVSFVAGEVGHVLAGCVRGGAWASEFRMPGCGRRLCCRGKIRRGWAIGPIQDGSSCRNPQTMDDKESDRGGRVRGATSGSLRKR
jgi:predicted Fe-Mo cluster-binding NifX family protein